MFLSYSVKLLLDILSLHAVDNWQLACWLWTLGQ